MAAPPPAATEKKKTFVLYPSLGVGHLNPMVELAKHLLRRGHSAVVAVVDPPDGDPTSAAAVARLAEANPSIAFRLLPAPPSPDPAAHPIKRAHDTLRLANPALRAFLRALPAPAHAILLDMFCVDALDVAADLALPAYFFFASAASDLAVFLHMPYLYPGLPSFKDMGELVRSPGMRPVRAADMPLSVQDKESDMTKARMYQFKRIAEGRGVLVFDWLEPTALKALADGVCVPGRPTPRVFCVGPLVNDGKKSGGGETRHECLAWLDAQPERSVVFLCFGSIGAVSAAQLREIAHGLESSGHRFLWVVRSPPADPADVFQPRPEPDLDALLPKGFTERTRDRGMVLKMWAPQAEVLRHAATGAFVTHCGWNSALEAIMAGVPMICYPMYAEQALNKVFMVEEMKIAVPLEGYEKRMVKAGEIEAKLRLVMETEEGTELRETLATARKMASDAIGDGGSSDVAFAEFLGDLENGGCNN
ncbi:LOW QUALITY PROTEIN: hypothetical protein CFC21_003553 [Triticum aestivum]|uniref:Glycosyltransferase n=1 Tax=Triticum aestivum TaxID=4565 RepID=A0A3B5Y521_WHEAT|nr:LOW QUALITY PROTEIN: hypothetical protein CFC21_003553 [Triticum aestivum]